MNDLYSMNLMYLFFRYHHIVPVAVKVMVMKEKKKRNQNFEHHHFLKNVKKKKKLKKLVTKINIKTKDNHTYISPFSLSLSRFCRGVFSIVEKFLFVYNTLTFLFLCLCVVQLCCCTLLFFYVCINL